jgi:NAD(P)-dependent dehydrogenase (short-subunit alcohol dehydrogenase family)
MRILIIGSSGTIGRAIVAALTGRHDLVLASKSDAPEQVDISDPASIRALYARIGRVDALVAAAGLAAFKPLAALTDADFALSLNNKLMGQVNLVRYGIASVSDGGSFTLTAGSLAREPARNGAAVSLVNAGLEGFARSAALELPRGQRINVVSPPTLSETLRAQGLDPSAGPVASDVARAYVASVEGKQTGTVLDPRERK